jgi:hypothetical protein
LLKYRHERGKRGNDMALDMFLGTMVGTLILVIFLERWWYEVHTNWKPRVILRRYADTEKALFALNEGETIVSVREEHNTLYFYVGNYSKDGKEYE